MPKITITRRRFPESDCNAVWTAVIDGVPTYEYSNRDYTLWSRTYGAPRSHAYGPITYMSPREFVRLSERQLINIIRSDVDESISFLRCCEQIASNAEHSRADYDIIETRPGSRTPHVLRTISARDWDDAMSQFVDWAVGWLDDQNSDSAIEMADELRFDRVARFEYDGYHYEVIAKEGDQ